MFGNLILVALLFLLAACGVQDEGEEVSGGSRFIKEQSERIGGGRVLHIYVDSETGCRYTARIDSALTPLMLADGTQDCNGDKGEK